MFAGFFLFDAQKGHTTMLRANTDWHERHKEGMFQMFAVILNDFLVLFRFKRKIITSYVAGLPDGIFSNQKYQFG
jgi:hypothetical protein